MKRHRLIGLCAVLALAICAIGASSAFALEGEGAPEFGRCVKKAKAEGSGYSDAGCTMAVGSGAKYEWKAGPGAKPKFVSEAREVETLEATRCLKWHKEVAAGHTEAAAELLEKWGYTKAQCEKVVKAHACFDWLRRGEPGEAEKAGYTKEECEVAAKEWEESYLKEAVVLETTTGDRVECEGESNTGEYSSTNTKKVVNVVARFTNCVATVGETRIKCTSEGAAEGEIVTSVLEGELGIIKADAEPVRDTVGISLAAASGGTIAQFECGPIFGSSIKITVTGSVIHPVNTNKMVLEEKEKFKQRKGVQEVENFQGGPQDVLETSINGGSPVRSGQELLTLLVNEEKIEVNTVV